MRTCWERWRHRVAVDPEVVFGPSAGMGTRSQEKRSNGFRLGGTQTNVRYSEQADEDDDDPAALDQQGRRGVAVSLLSQ